ncbi:hypothetical protein [Hyphomicrobium sulfonivorans]|uniref:hypothetical protein n=1 Tax=Hyphomicrobium sulfonivorans TaxID=121290 RepID=UPI00156D943B|nr:hypothetical protein [Hyphomicrobium sulfonivorans]MBI1649027.1 hypothetical protein [Hyphomicrobium sulfonivorans]
MHAKPKLALATVFLGTVAALATPANAACKKFGFTVNDYGKVGPTNDAKNLLDKHISEWASQNGVTNYSTGKKSVSCELFIDVILFDEYTCTASATVCWGGDAGKVGQQSATGEEGGDHPGTPVRKAEAIGEQAPQTAAAIAGTPTDHDASADEAVQADAAGQQDEPAPSETYADAAPESAADASQAHAAADVIVSEPEQPPAEAAAVGGQPLDDVAPAVAQQLVQPAVATATAIAVPEVPVAAAVETGALQSGAGLVNAPSVPAAAPASAVPSAEDRAAAASAAAAAAAAAERAAQAAETAANAAKAAAAAAVAASTASQKHGHASASVPPLDQAADAGAQ